MNDSKTEQQARATLAEWHRQKGLSQQIQDDSMSGAVSISELARELLTIALSGPREDGEPDTGSEKEGEGQKDSSAKGSDAVFMICHAYEAGFGKGVDGASCENPYVPGDECEAWRIGYNEEMRRGGHSPETPQREIQDPIKAQRDSLASTDADASETG